MPAANIERNKTAWYINSAYQKAFHADVRYEKTNSQMHRLKRKLLTLFFKFQVGSFNINVFAESD